MGIPFRQFIRNDGSITRRNRRRCSVKILDEKVDDINKTRKYKEIK